MKRALVAIVTSAIACATSTTPSAPRAPSSPVAAATPSPPPSPSPPPPPAPTAIDVDYDADADRWRVAWTVDPPTVALRFDRAAARGPRAATWIAGPGLTWRRDGDDDVLVAADGVARAGFAAAVDTDDRSPSRQPPLHLRFSDGARLVFTGALGADAELCDDTRCGVRARPRVWRLRAPGHVVVVGAARGDGDVTWDEAALDRRGTYAYVGRAPVITALGAGVEVVADRGLPPWLAAETARLVPAALAEFTARTGLAPGAARVLVSHRPGGSGGGYAVRGRALTGVVQLEASGSRWRRRDAAAAALWRELVVHEFFHLWNGQIARRAERRDEWLSEGSSSFVAGRALRDARLLDATRYGRRIVAAANRCARGLVGPLHAEAADASYYDCGEVVQVVLDRALVASGGLWPVYARLFADAVARPSGAYATADLLALCTAAGADPAVLARVTALLDSGLGAAPTDAVRALLADGGIATTIVPARRGRPARLRFRAPPRQRGGSVRP